MNHLKALLCATILLLTSCSTFTPSSKPPKPVVEPNWKDILTVQGAGLKGKVHTISIKAYTYSFTNDKALYHKEKFMGDIGKWTFHKDGRLAEFIDYKLPKPKVSEKEVFEYQSPSRAHSKTYDYHGKLIAKTSYAFQDGYIVHKAKVDLTEEIQYTLIHDYTYTDSTRIAVIYRDNAPYKDKRTLYIANDHVIKIEESLINDKYSTKEIRELNTHGDVVDSKTYGWDDTQTWFMYQYTYDDNGVWTLQAEGWMAVPTLLYEREITYY